MDLSQQFPPRIINLLELIVDSIPSKFIEILSSKDKKDLNEFVNKMGISSDFTNIVQGLTALLLLNRLRFVIQNEKKEDYMNLSMKNLSSNLERKYSKIFVSSILSSIGNQSSFIISHELFNYDNELKDISDNLFATLYKNYLKPEFRRKLGQFWTPEYISEFMMKLILMKEPRNIFDPCCGPGTFIQTLRRINPNYPGKTSGVEIHPLLYEIACVNSYSQIPNDEFIYGDFLTLKPEFYVNSIEDSMALSITQGLDSYIEPRKTRGFDAIICNPPYSRHHLVPSNIKKELGKDFENMFGGRFNRISSLFVYFILNSMKYLTKDGRMVFITPSIVFESQNSTYLKRILKKHFTIPLIITFHQSLNIFSGVDTAACIFVVEGNKPKETSLTRLRVIEEWSSNEESIMDLMDRQETISEWPYGEVYSKKQSELDPEKNWTSSRIFSKQERSRKLIQLNEFFKVMRGIATGNNNFFTLTQHELINLGIKREYVVPTITKTRYIQKYLLSEEDFKKMKLEGKKVWLLDIKEEINNKSDQNLLQYLKLGLESGVHEGSLIKTRKLWYSTEKRDVPTFIYTYLSRGNPRFIFNKACVRPLNTFLMIYPKAHIKLSTDDLILFWVVLNSNTTKQALKDVGRSYGGDTIKIEPKEMMKLQIINPFTISSKAKRNLLELAAQMKAIETVSSIDKKKIFKQIDKILEIELNKD